ncbi:hypothetical protein SEPCBS119000_002625 [Sporothrix epigloea]|uniref:Uncharacterized protein n=1 Tax=Sporothrix epigloea TaxID=1892477 RepID=A0ABP0DH71_9PEZI
MDTARLRRAFRYAADDNDHSDDDEYLDEEQQDALIESFAELNRQRNEQFRRVLLALPALAVIPFLLVCYQSSSSSAVTVTMLGISSLAATAALVHRQTPTKTGIRLLDAWSGADIKGKGRAVTARFSLSGWTAQQPPPLDQYLPFLNLGLCAVLVLSVFLPKDTASATFNTPYHVLGSLPAGVYAVVLLSKVTMAGVDPERELNKLRYGYKGA